MHAFISPLFKRGQQVALVALSLLSTACTTLPSFKQTNYVDAMDGAMVVENKTRYSEALECLRPYLANSTGSKSRFAVGRVNDFTGKEDLTNGKRITQGAALMVISALSKTGVPIVERFDTQIADMELKYADNKLIGDGADTHRRIFAGSLPGSDFHIMGGITEVNYNIRSGSVESSIKFIGSAARYFVMNVGIDLRVVNTKTLEVVNTQSLQKQIIGTELSGGYFRLFTDGVFDITAAERTQEPIQRAVRMVIEQAVFNMVTEMNGLPSGSCLTSTRLNKTAADFDEGNTRAANRNTAPLPSVAMKQAPMQNSGQGTIARTSAVAPAGQAATKIDPNTGEPLAAQGQSTPQAGELQGLFGTGTLNNQPGSPGNDPASGPSRQAMQERMLWGSRPTIR